jgi:putative hydrolase of HD superfamily
MMQTKAPIPYAHLNNKRTLALIEVYFEFNHLKHLYRQGWLHHGVATTQAESVAEHLFGVVVLAFFLADAYFPELDLAKVLRMALLHDFGEIYAGDFTPRDQVSQGDKQRLERDSITKVLGKLPRGAEYIALWEEFEEAQSPEARFVHQLDRLEMALQASIYEHQTGINLDEFFADTQGVLTAPQLQAIFTELQSLRRQL